MAQVNTNQQNWLVAINKVLPDVEYFLKNDLAKEHLSDFSNERRIDLLRRLETITTPPELPPRTAQLRKSVTVGQIESQASFSSPEAPRKLSDGNLLKKGSEQDVTAEFIQKQREISRQWGQAEISVEEEVPNATRPEKEGKKASKSRNSSSSSHDNSNLYERITSVNDDSSGISTISEETSKEKPQPATDVNSGTKDPPPVPDRSGRGHLRHPLKNWPSSDKTSEESVLVHSLKEPTYSGPLINLRNMAKLWCVLKQKNLYFFRDLVVPAHEIINMSEYDIHIDNVQKTMFRLKKPGFRSFLLAADNESEFEKWIAALERCKYEELHRTPTTKEAEKVNAALGPKTSNDGEDGYERPQDLLKKFEEQRALKLRQEEFQKSISSDSRRLPNEHYVDMSGKTNPLEDYETIDDSTVELLFTHSTPVNRETYYQTRSLPPIPPNKEKSEDGKLEVHSDDNSLSGGFESLDSDDGENQRVGGEISHQLKPRRLQEKKGKEFDFFHDLDAVYCGILYRRKMLAVWQKRYCKLKNDSLICRRNPDDAEKPILEVPLQGCKLEMAAKETRKNTAFKLRRPNGDNFYFAAGTQELMMKWITFLAQIIDKGKVDKTEESEASTRNESKKRLSQISTGDTNSVDSREYQMIDEFSDDKGLRVQSSGSESEPDTDSDDSSDGEVGDSGTRTSRAYDMGTVRSKIMRKLKMKNRTSAESSDEFDDTDSDIRGYLYRFYAQRWSRKWCVISHRKFLVYKKASVHHPEDVLLLQNATLSVDVVDEHGKKAYNLLLLIPQQGDLFILSSYSSTDWEVWKSLLLNLVPTAIGEKKISVPPPPWYGRRSLENGSSFAGESQLHGDRLNERKSVDVSTLHVVGKMTEVRYKSGKPTEVERWFSLIGREMKICDTKDSLEPRLVLDLRNTVIRRMKLEGGIGSLFSFEFMRDNEEKTMDFKLDEETQMKLTPVLWTSEAQLIGFETMTLGRRKRVSHSRRDGMSGSLLSDYLIEEKSTSSGNMAGSRGSETTLNVTKYRGKSASVPESILQATLPGSKDSSSDLTPRSKTRSSAAPAERVAGSRVSRLFKSLTSDRRNKKHKYRLAKEEEEKQAGAHPKAQFHGMVEEVKTAKDGSVQRIPCCCRVSGKIFYAFEENNMLKPIFKVPLRSAAIEDRVDHDSKMYTINLTSMEDNTDFMFAVASEQELDIWLTALTDPSYVSLAQSSKESLLSDEPDGKSKGSENSSKDQADEVSPTRVNELHNSLQSGSMENRRLSAQEPKKSKDGEESLERVRLEGFLFVSKSADMTTTNLRQWVVLKKTKLEIYDNKKGRNPRVLLLSDFSFTSGNPEEKREKFKLILKAEQETVTLLCNDEKDHFAWAKELKRLTRRRTRIGSDSAKSLFKSTSGNLRQLLTKSDNGKSKRATIILDDGDQEVVEKYVDFLAPINSLSGPLRQVYEDGVTKERFCVIKDKSFLVYKANKPEKQVKKLDLTKVTLLDETDDAANKYMFRLDSGTEKAVLFECQDRSSAERWMVAVSMAMLLDKLQFGGSRTDLQKSVSDYEFLALAGSPTEERKGGASPSLQETVGVKRSSPFKKDYKKSSSADDLLSDREKDRKPSPRESISLSLSDLTSVTRNCDKESPGSPTSVHDPTEESYVTSEAVTGSMEPNESDDTLRLQSSSGIVTKKSSSRDSTVSLEDLLTNKELLESEKYTLQKCLSELKTVVDESRNRRRLSRSPSGSGIEPALVEEELRTAKNDQQKMKKRLSYVDKELRKVNNEINRRYSRSYLKQISNARKRWYSDTPQGSSGVERRSSAPNGSDDVFVQTSERNEDCII